MSIPYCQLDLQSQTYSSTIFAGSLPSVRYSLANLPAALESFVNRLLLLLPLPLLLRSTLLPPLLPVLCIPLSMPRSMEEPRPLLWLPPGRQLFSLPYPELPLTGSLYISPASSSDQSANVLESSRLSPDVL